MKEKLQELEMLKNRAESIAVQMKLAVEVLSELEMTKRALERLEEEILVPLGSNIYLRAKIKEGKLLYGIGADVFVEKTREEILKELKAQIEKLDSKRGELSRVMDAIKKRAEEINLE